MQYFKERKIPEGKIITFVITEFNDKDLAKFVNKYVIPSRNINLEF